MRAGGIGPVLQGQRGVQTYSQGRRTFGTEVTVETPHGRRRIDVVEVDPVTGEPIAVEIKTGNSPYKPRQRACDKDIEDGKARGVGPRAREAGLEGPIQLKTKLVRLPKEP